MRRTTPGWKFLAAVLCTGIAASALVAQPPPKPDDPNAQIEVDARGPIHEAFAQPWSPNPVPHEPIAKKPPEPIPEEPATEKPQGKNVQWIPGYWQWDSDRKDFIWVSGLWRDLPEGRRWIVGYWADTAEGYRWVSGHFASEREKDNQYVPQPPQDKDEGPTTQAPDDNSFYIPGTYFYTDNGYQYRDGYWADSNADQIWVPARYIWTPYGYVFASGYWDYPLTRRGLLFAPVYFSTPLWQRPGWVYRPSYVINSDGMYNSFFVGLGWGHYFFGDYYARSYLDYGITPWFWYGTRWYDPIWNHERWVNRTNPNWANRVQESYIARVNGRQPLPGRTFSAQARASANVNQLVTPLSQARVGGNALVPVTAEQRTVHTRTATEMLRQSREASRTSRTVTTTNKINITTPLPNNPTTFMPKAVPSTRPLPRTTPPVTNPGSGQRVVTPPVAPHIPTGVVPNIQRPSFPPPHPGGFPGGHGAPAGRPHK